MKARRPLRTRTRVQPINKARKATLREKQYGSERFSTWLHRLACVVPGCDERDIEQAHAKSRGAGGYWYHTVPCCRTHHREQHDIGLVSWERRHGLDLIALARQTALRWLNLGGDWPEGCPLPGFDPPDAAA